MSKDFWSGLLFMGMGAAALILGSDLRVGTTARMGPTGLRPSRHRLDPDRASRDGHNELIGVTPCACVRCSRLEMISAMPNRPIGIGTLAGMQSDDNALAVEGLRYLRGPDRIARRRMAREAT